MASFQFKGAIDRKFKVPCSIKDCEKHATLIAWVVLGEKDKSGGTLLLCVKHYDLVAGAYTAGKESIWH